MWNQLFSRLSRPVWASLAVITLLAVSLTFPPVRAIANSSRIMRTNTCCSGSRMASVGRRLVRDIIRDLRQRGTAVFLNSHLLSEVEIAGDRVAFIKHGRVIRISPLKDLVEGELSVEVCARNLSPEIVAGLSRWSQSMRADGEHLPLTLGGEGDLPAINRYLVEQGVDVYALRPQHISLEDLFIEIVGTDGGL